SGPRAGARRQRAVMPEPHLNAHRFPTPSGLATGFAEPQLGGNMPYRSLFYLLNATLPVGALLSFLSIRLQKPTLGAILLGLSLFFIPLFVYALAMPVLLLMGWRQLNRWERLAGCTLELLIASWVVYGIIDAKLYRLLTK